MILNISLYYKKEIVTGANKRLEFFTLSVYKNAEISIVVCKNETPEWAITNNIPVYELDCSINDSRIKKWYYLSKFLLNIEPSIIINDFMPIPFFLSRKKHIFYQLVHDIRNNTQFHRSSNKIWSSRFQKYQWKISKNIITVSKFTKEQIIKLCDIHKDKIFVSYNGIDDSAIEPIELINSSNRDIDLLYIATFEKRKNHINLLKSIENIDFDLNIIFLGRDLGNLNEIQKYYAQILTKKKNINIEFIESVENEGELKKLYLRSKVFVSPSLYEGFGMPIIEAMTNGCIISCSNIDVFKEIASKYAYFFDPENINDIESVLIDCLKKENLAVKEQVEYVKEKFTWDSIAKKFIELNNHHTTNPNRD